MRDSGAKVVTSMLDVQLKIIWQFDLIDSLILPTIFFKFDYILGEFKSSKAINWLYIPFQTVKCWKIFNSLFFMEKRLGKFKNGWENLL